jgi:hypothetical protein
VGAVVRQALQLPSTACPAASSSHPRTSMMAPSALLGTTRKRRERGGVLSGSDGSSSASWRGGSAVRVLRRRRAEEAGAVAGAAASSVSSGCQQRGNATKCARAPGGGWRRCGGGRPQAIRRAQGYGWRAGSREHRACPPPRRPPALPARSPGVGRVCQQHLEPRPLPLVQRHLMEVFYGQSGR